jgi:hypothetical protein
MRQDLIAALEQIKIELTAEFRTELRGVRAEIGGLRKAVEMIAINLLSGSEVQKVRKVMTG